MVGMDDIRLSETEYLNNPIRDKDESNGSSDSDVHAIRFSRPPSKAVSSLHTSLSTTSCMSLDNSMTRTDKHSPFHELQFISIPFDQSLTFVFLSQYCQTISCMNLSQTVCDIFFELVEEPVLFEVKRVLQDVMQH